MPSKGVKQPPVLLPPGTVWETRAKKCLKCAREFRSRGYRYVKSGRWIGKHLCPSCNESNKDIRRSRGMGPMPLAEERVRGM